MIDVELVEAVGEARAGSQEAWDLVVNRFASLVWNVARAQRLSTSDAADVSQTVWLRLAEHIGQLREPDRIGSWLAVTTRHEAQRVRRRGQIQIPVSNDRFQLVPAAHGGAVEDGLVLEEDSAQLWKAFSQLGEKCRTLLRLLITDPSPSYAVVSETLGLPLGSIGPTRARCLATLRQHFVTPDVSLSHATEEAAS